MLASKFMHGTSSTEADIVHSRDEDLWLMGCWQGAARRKRRKQQQQKTRAFGSSASGSYGSRDVIPRLFCCSQLAILESQGIQVQGHQYDPYNYR